MDKNERTEEFALNEEKTDNTEYIAREKEREKSIVIIGASSGIGYETALRLLGRGFAVSNISRKSPH